jgi:hypothetical protein
MDSRTDPGMEPTPAPTSSPGVSPAEAAPPDAMTANAAPAASAEATAATAPPDAASGHATVAARAAARHASAFGRGTARLIVSHKLETVAVLLLGVGGAVFPPVWLLGVLTALPSRKWDLRDKWVGLVAPVLLMIISTVLIVILGGKQPTIGSYVLEAWLAATRASRIAAALGAAYLLWRLSRGPRDARQPPFGVPQRLG